MAETSTDIPALKRQLEIQTGATKRLTKEHNLYRKEAEQQQAKLNKLIAEAEGEDSEWYIKNGRNMLDEANKMIKDSADRLSKTALVLKDAIANASKESALTSDEVFKKAEETLKEASV